MSPDGIIIEQLKMYGACLSRLNEARLLVQEQAADEALWFDAVTAPECYLQQAIRHLHAVIEGPP